jgi:DNA polymerase-3 subunit gamma/tau
VLYGKYRPQGFDEVVGQDHIVTTLRNALIASDSYRRDGGDQRRDPLAHGFLFSGPRGTGKTTTARILAKAVNCADLREGDPCGACASCVAITQGRALDLIEMDAASNRGIDDIRELREKIGYAPSDLNKKVYLLDEVHMLTEGAFNALLKTLEEPPPHAIFILATTEAHKVPITIRSRCQRYDFRRVPNDAIVSRLQVVCDSEGFDIPGSGLLTIAIQSRGGMRDAITLLEQVTARYGLAPTHDEVLAGLGLVQDERSAVLARAIVDSDLAGALEVAREVADSGIDMADFTRATLDLLRAILPDVLRKQLTPGREEPERSLAEAALAANSSMEVLVTAIRELAEADFRLDPASPIPLEIACASSILGPAPAVVAAASASAGAPSLRSSRNGARTPATIPADSPLSSEERFLKQLYERCRLVDARLAGWLNGSCEVVTLSDDELVLGFYHEVHRQKVDTDVRTLVEQQAEALAGHALKLTLQHIEQSRQPRRESRRGHLAEAARAMGATPVTKE